MFKTKIAPEGFVVKATYAKNPEPLNLVVGVDAGSTQTRVALADAKDIALLSNDSRRNLALDFLTDCVYTIPSTYAVVPDNREILPTSERLHDNYDSSIIAVSCGAVKPIVESSRVVRGRKLTDCPGLVSRYMDSSTNKMDNQVFYINVLDGIGYAILQKYSGSIPEAVNISMVLSVRPKERNQVCRKLMDDNFLGEYLFRWCGLTIRMNIVSTDYTTEPEAQITGTQDITYLKADIIGDSASVNLYEKLDEGGTSYIHIEGGGSSIGVEVVSNGDLMSACSATFPLGGNYLSVVLRERIRDEKGYNVSETAVASAVTTCMLKNGRDQVDVSKLVAECKTDVAMEIFENMRHNSLDLARNLTIRDIDFITLGGRLFKPDDCGNSIAHFFKQYVEQLSPHTEVIVLEDNYIPQGNLLIGISSGDFSIEEDSGEN